MRFCSELNVLLQQSEPVDAGSSLTTVPHIYILSAGFGTWISPLPVHVRLQTSAFNVYVLLFSRSTTQITKRTLPPCPRFFSSTGASVRHSSPPSWRIKTPGSPSSTTTNANLRNAVRSARRAARWSAWVSGAHVKTLSVQKLTQLQLQHLKLMCIKCVCVFAGKLCIEVTPQSKIVWISESLCIGCGICIKVITPRDGFQTVFC